MILNRTALWVNRLIWPGSRSRSKLCSGFLAAVRAVRTLKLAREAGRMALRDVEIHESCSLLRFARGSWKMARGLRRRNCLTEEIVATD